MKKVRCPDCGSHDLEEIAVGQDFSTYVCNECGLEFDHEEE